MHTDNHINNNLFITPPPIFFETNDTNVLSFLAKYSIIKQNNIRYYLLTNFTAFKFCIQK